MYVDNDPLVLAHARALLTSSPEGRTAYIQADLRDPAAILSDPAARAILDFSQPIALMLVAVLHFIPDDFRPAEILATLLDALPSGSFLVASHVSMEDNPVLIGNAMSAYRAAGLPAQARDSDDFARLAFAGLELVPPGVVLVSEWRQETDAPRPAPRAEPVRRRGPQALIPPPGGPLLLRLMDAYCDHKASRRRAARAEGVDNDWNHRRDRRL